MHVGTFHCLSPQLYNFIFSAYPYVNQHSVFLFSWQYSATTSPWSLHLKINKEISQQNSKEPPLNQYLRTKIIIIIIIQAWEIYLLPKMRVGSLVNLHYSNSRRISHFPVTCHVRCPIQYILGSGSVRIRIV